MPKTPYHVLTLNVRLTDEQLDSLLFSIKPQATTLDRFKSYLSRRSAVTRTQLMRQAHLTAAEIDQCAHVFKSSLEISGPPYVYRWIKENEN